MIFSKFREFRLQRFQSANEKVESILNYLGIDLAYNFKDLVTGLRRLSFSNNFETYIITVTVPSGGSDLPIRHPLNKTPQGMLVIKNNGNYQVVDGTTAWTTNFVFLRNLGSSNATITVCFFTEL